MMAPATFTSTPKQSDWLHVTHCPACNGAPKRLSTLFNQSFRLGVANASPPPEPVCVMRCINCDLIFKNWVAGPILLERMTAVAHGGLWTRHYDYRDELAAIRAVDPDALDDVIDVGAASGGFLNAIDQSTRKSALDIVQFDALKINGEFIKGFLDDPNLIWSGKPYRLAGLFDVAEHLYDPPRAFANLRALCASGGLVIAETGDSDAVPERKLGQWAYINLLEHHIAWNRNSLEAMAARSGFEIVTFERKVHKGRPAPTLRQRLKSVAFSVAPGIVKMLYASARKPFDIPSTQMVDHMRVILRAI